MTKPASPNAPYVWRSFTEWTSPWPDGGAPQGIRVDRQGNIWFDQEGSVCAVGRLDTAEDKNMFTFWTLNPDSACTRGGIDLDLDAEDKVRSVWFTYGHGQIRRLDPITNQITAWVTPGLNPSIAVDSSGAADQLRNVYFTDSAGNTIGQINPIANKYTSWTIPTSSKSSRC